MKRILITGSTGMLGSDLVRKLTQFSEYEIYGLGRSMNMALSKSNQFTIDLARPFSPESIPVKPDVIIHTAAITDLNLCERDPELADRVHVQASKTVASLAGKNTKFIYISTDSVFDGKKGNYSEDDIPNPLNQYARSKLRGEQAVLETNVGITHILRTNIYGFHTPIKNSLAEWAYAQLKNGNTISGFTDITFNAVFTGQLVGVIQYLIANSVKDAIVNVGSKTSMSKHAFLDRFRKSIGVSDSLLKAAVSTDFPSALERPKDTSLNISRLSNFYPVPEFEDGIREWIQDAQQCGAI